MARTFDGIVAIDGATTQASSLRAVARLRLAFGLVALLGAIIFLEGTSWDIQWHSYIGRDRTLIPPHIMMLSGIALSGIAGLLTVLIESWWVRHNDLVAKHSLSFAEVFSGPLGAYLVGFMALTAAVAFPLDAYWHALYGIDVAIWAPFHIMFAASMGVVALGTAYMLASAAQMAASVGASAIGIRRAAMLGVVLALATVLSIFTLLLFDALKRGNFIDLGFMSINVFPLLSSLLVAFVLITAAYVIPWRWAATFVSACYLCLAVVMAVFVQPATAWLLTVERLNYRRSVPFTSVVALEWFITPLFVALLIDVIMHRARRKQWPEKKLLLFLVLAALLSGALPIIPASPLYAAVMFLQLGIAGFLASLLLGLAGAYLGAFFGRNVGESINALERE
jgi:hypothetical protein